MNWSPPPLPFFGLGVTKNTAKHEFFLPFWTLCQKNTAKHEFFLPIGADDFSSGLCSSGKLMFENNEAHPSN
jgi:hypothetical protein